MYRPLLNKAFTLVVLGFPIWAFAACSDETGNASTSPSEGDSGSGGHDDSGSGGHDDRGSGGRDDSGSGGQGGNDSAGGQGLGGDGGAEAADTTPPTVTITDATADETATGDVTFTFTFSEDVGGSLVAGDVTVEGGTAGVFTVVNATTATLVVSPTPLASGTIEVSIPAGSFEDVAGNANTVTASAVQDYNTFISTLLFDFDGVPADPMFIDFDGGAGSIVDDPINSANKVGRIIKNGGQVWGGVVVGYCSGDHAATIPTVPVSAESTVFTMAMWSPAAGVPIRLVMENVDNGAISYQGEVTTTTSNAWETLTFDFSEAGAAQYGRLAIYPDIGTVGTGETYYFDDVRFIGESFNTTCP